MAQELNPNAYNLLRALLAFAEQEANSIESSTSSTEQTEDFILAAMTGEWTLDRICRCGKKWWDSNRCYREMGILAKKRWIRWIQVNNEENHWYTVGTPLVPLVRLTPRSFCVRCRVALSIQVHTPGPGVRLAKESDFQDPKVSTCSKFHLPRKPLSWEIWFRLWLDSHYYLSHQFLEFFPTAAVHNRRKPAASREAPIAVTNSSELY